MPQEEEFFKSENPNIDPVDEQEMPEPDKGKKGNSRSRILLLVLLLLVIVAAALFYLGPGLLEPEVARTPAPPPKKKVVKLPAPESPAKTSPAEKGVVKEEVPEQPVAAVEKVEAPAQEQPAASAEAPAAEEGAGPVETVADEPPPAPVAAGKYVLQAGAYLLESNLKSVEATVAKLGYRARLAQDTKKVEMTRLKVGRYDKQTAQAKLQKLRRLAPDAFTMAHDGQMSVYAGSYYSLDRARAFADRLYAEGVQLEEERVEVELPITIVRFGAFEDRSEAEKVASRARDAGLEIAVVEKR